MSTSTTIERIRAAVAKLDRRVRLQRMMQAVVTSGCWAMLLGVLGLTLFKTGWMGESSALLFLQALVLIPASAAVWAWTRPLDIIDLAQRVDQTHSLHDRLSTALFLGQKQNLDEFEEAQILDAARYLEQVDIKLAAPTPRPVDGVMLGVLAVVFVAIWVIKPPSHEKPLPPAFEIKHDAVLDAATLALERERLEAIKKALETSEAPEDKELVEEIDNLLDKVENQEISDKDFLQELDRIEKKFFDKQGEAEVEKLADALKKAAEELEKKAKKDLEKEPEAQKLVDALKNKDLDKAAEAMKDIADKLEKKDLDAKDLERLAKLMEMFADSIDLDDPALQKFLEENQKLIDQLSELFKKDGLTEQEKQRLNKAKQQQKDLQKKRDDQKRSKYRRSLQQLKRKTKDLAKNAKDAAEQKKKGKTKKAERGEEEQKFRNQAGRHSKDMKRQLEEQAKKQKQSEAKKMARKQLEEMREAMQRSRRDSGEKKDGEQGEEKAGQIKEYLDRAKGKKPEDGQQKDGKADDAGKAGENGDRKKSARAGEGEAKKGSQGEAKQLDGKEPSSDIAGKGQGDRTLKDETKLDAKRKDEQLKGKEGKGASRSEIIKSASEEGFANTQYKDVYVDYESVVEEVMDKESVPAGYRFYVKRYFQLIKPQE